MSTGIKSYRARRDRRKVQPNGVGAAVNSVCIGGIFERSGINEFIIDRVVIGGLEAESFLIGVEEPAQKTVNKNAIVALQTGVPLVVLTAVINTEGQIIIGTAAANAGLPVQIVIKPLDPTFTGPGGQVFGGFYGEFPETF